jgi:hypothetical protein
VLPRAGLDGGVLERTPARDEGPRHRG